MGHDYHEGAPNYNPSQLYYDGCAECKYRTEDLYLAIAHVRDFREAWMRAARFEKGNLTEAEQVSVAEAPLLRLLRAVQVHLERYGLPLGAFPGDLVSILDAHLGSHHHSGS